MIKVIFIQDFANQLVGEIFTYRMTLASRLLKLGVVELYVEKTEETQTKRKSKNQNETNK